MNALSLLILILASLVLGATSSAAGIPGTQAVPDQVPVPGNSKKCTRVDFDHDNNGWGNGDQDAPGNSGDHNQAENGPGNAPGNGNGNHGGSNKSADAQDENLAPEETDDETQRELHRLELEALARQAQLESAAQSQGNDAAAQDADAAADASVTKPANQVVARRAK